MRRVLSLAGALVPLALVFAITLTGAGTPARGDGTPDQCVACHTDATQLQRLTPPDPPATESGEG